MAEKRVFMRFGSGTPQAYSGLTPSFLYFINAVSGASIARPAITEIGTSIGFYTFTYDVGASTIVGFNIDGGAAITDSNTRYVADILDPIVAVDRHLGFPTDGYGTTVGASTVYGEVSRLDQLWKSDATFSKLTGVWQVFATGTSTMLYQKTLANNSANVVKT